MSDRAFKLLVKIIFVLILGQACLFSAPSSAGMPEVKDTLNQIHMLLLKLRGDQEKINPYGLSPNEVKVGVQFSALSVYMRGYFVGIPKQDAILSYEIIGQAKPPDFSEKDLQWFTVRSVSDGRVLDMPVDLISRWSITENHRALFKSGHRARLRRGIPELNKYADLIVEVLTDLRPDGIYKVRLLELDGSSEIPVIMNVPYFLLMPILGVEPSELVQLAKFYEMPLERRPLKRINARTFEWINENISIVENNKHAMSVYVELDHSDITIGYLEIGRWIIESADFQSLSLEEKSIILIEYAQILMGSSHCSLTDLRNSSSNSKFSDLLRLRRGVCQELSEWVGLLLYEAGYNPIYRRSIKGNVGHGWIEVGDKKTGVLIVDPGANLVGEKESLRTSTNPSSKKITYWYFDPQLAYMDLSIAPPFIVRCQDLLTQMRLRIHRQSRTLF